MAAFNTDCTTCTAPAGSGQADLLTVHLGQTHIDLIGLNVDICPICIRVYSTTGATTLTDQQIAALQQILSGLQNLIGSVTHL